MHKWNLCGIVLLCALTSPAYAQNQNAAMPSSAIEALSPTAQTQTKWVADSLKEMQKIKVGMTRAQLLQVFTEEPGGISTRAAQEYIYRKCSYFTVNVQFKPVGKGIRGFGSPKDRITKISEPFIQELVFN